MTITETHKNNKLTIALSGRLDVLASPTLQDILTPAFETEPHIELDFTDLAYVSSAGLRVLLVSQKAAKTKDVLFTISNVSEEVMEILDMTGFSDILTIV